MEQRTPVITTREELKKDASVVEWKNLIAQGWKRTEEDWTRKKRARVAYH